MTLDFIVTIDPIKSLSLLNVIVHSLNLQTNKNFQVIFYNQTLHSEQDLLDTLTVRPNFPYKFFSIDRKDFLGKYPIWNLYGFHNFLLEQKILTDYSMSLHMEEFLDVDYVEHALAVLESNRFDILFGNLSRTQLHYEDVQPILETRTPAAFNQFLQEHNLHQAYHWMFKYSPMFPARRIPIKVLKANIRKLYHFGFRKQLRQRLVDLQNSELVTKMYIL